MSSESTCLICNERLSCRWTDTHGVGACTICGCPYRLYHYENNKPIDKPPTCLIQEKYREMMRLYWNTHHRNVSPCYGNFPGSDYEVASAEDVKMYNQWLQENMPS